MDTGATSARTLPRSTTSTAHPPTPSTSGAPHPSGTMPYTYRPSIRSEAGSRSRRSGPAGAPRIAPARSSISRVRLDREGAAAGALPPASSDSAAARSQDRTVSLTSAEASATMRRAASATARSSASRTALSGRSALAQLPHPRLQRAEPVLQAGAALRGAPGQRGVARPPVDPELRGLVGRRDQEPQLDREQLDVEQVDRHVARDHDPLVQDPLQDVGEARSAPRRDRPAPGPSGPQRVLASAHRSGSS